MEKLKQWCSWNWFYLKDAIDYDWDRYKDWFVSITSILKLIVDPKFEYVLQNNKEAVEQACINWTAVHKEAEDFFTKWSWVDTINKNFMMFHTLYNIESIAQEQTFYKEWVRWTIDAIWRKETEVSKLDHNWYLDSKNVYTNFNIDYKNSIKHSPKYCLQMWWYKWLNWNDWILVYGKWKLNVIEVQSFYEELFIELKDYFFKILNDEKSKSV